MRPAEMTWTGLRWLYALFFFTTGLAIAVHVLLGVGGPPRAPTAAAQAFHDALGQTRFMDALVGASYLAGGGALLLRRTTPLGLVLLAPAATVILFDNVLLAGTAPVGLATAAVWGLLAWRFRSAFQGLWTYGAPGPAAGA